MSGAVEEAIAAELSSIFTVRPVVPCSEWANTNVFLGEKQTSRPGLYNSGFYDYDNKLVVAHYTALQDFFGTSDV